MKKNVNVENQNEGLVVLSLFDGISCGQIAFKQLDIKVKKYMASEIKSCAINQTLKNFPNTIMVGDVTKLHYQKKTKRLYANCERILIDSLDKHKGKNEWTKDELKSFSKKRLHVLPNGDVVRWKGGTLVHEGEIDLLIGGSPCQGFSFAYGYAHSSETSGLKHVQSCLFFDYLRLLKEIRPKKWFLENVKMKKSNEEALNAYLGRKGIHINSNLLTFQNRERIYWTNIRGVKPPKDLKISFQDYKLKTIPRVERWIRATKFEGKTKPLILTPKEIDEIYEMNKWVHDELKQINPNTTKEEVVEEVHQNLFIACAKRTPSKIRYWNGGVYDPKIFMCKNITNSNKVYALTLAQDRAPNSGVLAFDDFFRFLAPLELCKAQGVHYKYLHNLSYGQIQNLCGDSWTISVVESFFEKLK